MRFATTMKTPIILSVSLILSGLLLGQDSPKPEAATSEEYSVYAAALQEVVGGFSFVVVSTTSMPDKPEQVEKALSFPIEFESLITQDLVEDFKAKNKSPQLLGNHFPPEMRVTLITEREHDALFADSFKDGWKSFRMKYLGSSGITRVSRVGFNQQHDTAIVYVANVRDWEAGGGGYVLLSKTNGKWTVVSHTRGWIT